jgi:hypothetical protein
LIRVNARLANEAMKVLGVKSRTKRPVLRSERLLR